MAMGNSVFVALGTRGRPVVSMAMLVVLFLPLSTLARGIFPMGLMRATIIPEFNKGMAPRGGGVMPSRRHSVMDELRSQTKPIDEGIRSLWNRPRIHPNTTNQIQFKTFREKLVPPIPKLEPRPLKALFRPRFILNELLYGIRYRTKTFAVFILCSNVCHMVRWMLSPKPSSYEANVTKGLASQACSIPDTTDERDVPRWVKHYVLVPIFEEIVYRGVLQRILTPLSVRLIWRGLSVLLGRNMSLGVVQVGIVYLSSLAMFWSNMESRLKEYSGFGVWYGAALRVFLFARDFLAHSMPFVFLAPAFQRVLVSDLHGTTKVHDTEEKDELKQAVDRAALECSVWQPTVQFAFDTITDELEDGVGSVSDMLKDHSSAVFQRVSFLVLDTAAMESRLVRNRENLWCAIGAHCAHNILCDLYTAFDHDWVDWWQSAPHWLFRRFWRPNINSVEVEMLGELLLSWTLAALCSWVERRDEKEIQ